MIEHVWAVIDPQYDRPFFSSQPPPGNLERNPGAMVIRFEVDVPEVLPVDRVVRADTHAHARTLAWNQFKALRNGT